MNVNQTGSTIVFVHYNPFNDYNFVESCWQDLQKRCSHSFFLSWGWISTWLKSLDKKSDIRFIVGYLDQKPVLAFFVGLSIKNAYKIIRSKIASINTTGSNYYDQLFLEYNGVLKDFDVKFGIQELMQALKGINWDEFQMPGISPEFVNEAGFLNPEGSFIRPIVVDEVSNASYVDLEEVRKVEFNYLSLISANKRSQIRRSIKEYEMDSEIQVTEASTLDQALIFFSELVQLHQREWESRGDKGSFSNTYLLDFHRDLINSRFVSGEIQILKVHTKDLLIGYLYNFIYDRRVYFYQGGLNYLPKNVYRPGLVSHYYAIIHNAHKELAVYDFLAGDAAYKTSLATGSHPLYWLRLFRNPLFYYIKQATSLVRSLR